MTNAEKYKEAFGMEPDKSSCPTKLCKCCPVNDYKDEQGFRVGAYGRLDEIRPHGEWIPNDKISPWGNPGRSCSLCGKIVEFSENFCPKCGADMRGIYNGKKETT